ncbi:hypothetical protein HK405_014608, partial [Cladochytrium tenue]
LAAADACADAHTFVDLNREQDAQWADRRGVPAGSLCAEQCAFCCAAEAGKYTDLRDQDERRKHQCGWLLDPTPNPKREHRYRCSWLLDKLVQRCSSSGGDSGNDCGAADVLLFGVDVDTGLEDITLHAYIIDVIDSANGDIVKFLGDALLVKFDVADIPAPASQSVSPGALTRRTTTAARSLAAPRHSIAVGQRSNNDIQALVEDTASAPLDAGIPPHAVKSPQKAASERRSSLAHSSLQATNAGVAGQQYYNLAMSAATAKELDQYRLSLHIGITAGVV